MVHFYLLYIVFGIYDLVDEGRSGPLGVAPQAHWWAAETRLTVASRLDG